MGKGANLIRIKQDLSILWPLFKLKLKKKNNNNKTYFQLSATRRLKSAGRRGAGDGDEHATLSCHVLKKLGLAARPDPLPSLSPPACACFLGVITRHAVNLPISLSLSFHPPGATPHQLANRSACTESTKLLASIQPQNNGGVSMLCVCERERERGG